MKAVRPRRVKGYSGVTPRGASRSVVRQGLSEQARHRLWKLLIVVLVVGAVGGVYYLGSGALSQWLKRPIASVTVEGDFRYLPKERVMTVITAQIDADFMQLDLHRMKQALEQEPWIERAALARRWPDVLEVRIFEERPIARWGSRGFLNQRGELIELSDNAVLNALPRMDGRDQDALEVMRRYQEIAHLLRTRGLDVTSLEQDRKRAWRLVLGGEIELVLGRDQVMEKMQRFIKVYDLHLQKDWQAVKAVDLRYSNGVAVRWHDEP